jgi:DNA-binding transcriptional MerR regulator
LRQLLAPDVKKLYYSIGEVSEITGLKSYVLRYWETEFTNLSPGKSRAGNRVYTEENINTILEIKRLLYDERFTIEGARQYFKNDQSNNRSIDRSVSPASLIREKELARKALRDVQESLTDLIELINRQK